MRSKDLISRISGISLPFFGVSWNPSPSDRKVAVRVIKFLEDRRVVYQTRMRDDVVACVESVHEIRKKLTKELEELDPNQPLSKMLTRMRAACRKFHDSVAGLDLPEGDIGSLSPENVVAFNLALGELRSAVGQEIAHLSYGYEIDIEDSLEAILPAKDDQGT